MHLFDSELVLSSHLYFCFFFMDSGLIFSSNTLNKRMKDTISVYETLTITSTSWWVVVCLSPSFMIRSYKDAFLKFYRSESRILFLTRKEIIRISIYTSYLIMLNHILKSKSLRKIGNNMLTHRKHHMHSVWRQSKSTNPNYASCSSNCNIEYCRLWWLMPRPKIRWGSYEKCL